MNMENNYDKFAKGSFLCSSPERKGKSIHCIIFNIIMKILLYISGHVFRSSYHISKYKNRNKKKEQNICNISAGAELTDVSRISSENESSIPDVTGGTNVLSMSEIASNNEILIPDQLEVSSISGIAANYEISIHDETEVNKIIFLY
jgi:hypothetical protein